MDKILIIDFGAQGTQLIARRLREAGVYCEIDPQDVDALRACACDPPGATRGGSPPPDPPPLFVRRRPGSLIKGRIFPWT